jgi:hypothetical protein
LVTDHGGATRPADSRETGGIHSFPFTGADTMTTCTAIDADLEALLSLGARIVPVARHDKRPLGTAWQTRATDDPDTIARWLARGNVGILLGHGGLIDIEYDDDAGRLAFHAMRTAAGVPFADIETPTWESSRGVHRLYRLAGTLPDRGWIKRGGLEIRLGGKPAQSVLPPSIHPSGVAYAWTISPQQCDPATVTLADLGIGGVR